MFAREQRQTSAPRSVRRKAEPAAAAMDSATHPLAAPSRKVCPCGGGCPRCVASAAESQVFGARTDGAEHEAENAASSVVAGQSRTIQTKLAVGEADGPFEREADHIAEQVLLGGPMERAREPLHIQRLATDSSAAPSQVPASVDAALAGPGRPLEPSVREDMEARFGHDFSKVRIHADGVGEQSARDLHAHAYTTGNDIVFGANRFAPSTVDSRRLLAHELTHVVQQRGQPVQIQRDANDEGYKVELMPDITLSDDPKRAQLVYAFRGKPWVTVKYGKRTALNSYGDKEGQAGEQFLVRVQSMERLDVTLDLAVEREVVESRKKQPNFALGYDLSFHGSVRIKDGALTTSMKAPSRRIVRDTTTYPVSREGLPEAPQHVHEETWLPGTMRDTYPSFANQSQLHAYLSGNPKRSFAIIRTKDGRYIARPVTGDGLRALADNARGGNFKAHNLEDIDWYNNAYQTGEFQALWVEGQEYTDLSPLRDLFFKDADDAKRDSDGGRIECEVYAMGRIDTLLFFARKRLSHAEAVARWHEIDKLSWPEFHKLETSPGHRLIALHARGVSQMHEISDAYVEQADHFRQQVALVEQEEAERTGAGAGSRAPRTPTGNADTLSRLIFETYFAVQLDRDEDDPDFVAILQKHPDLTFTYGSYHYEQVVAAGQSWAAESFGKSADSVRDFVNDDLKLTRWVLTCPQLPQQDLMRTLYNFDMMDDTLLWYNALANPRDALAIASGGKGNQVVTLERLRAKILETAKKMDDAEASILKGDIVAIKQEGEFGEAVRKGVYQKYGYTLDPKAFPYKDKLPKSHAFDTVMMGGDRASFRSLGEQMFATSLRREVAEDEVDKWAKIIGMLVATVILVVVLNAAGAAIAGAMFAEGTIGYLAVSALVVGTGLTATEYLQTRLAGGDMTIGELLKAEAWNVLTAGLLGRLGFAFKDASTIVRVGVVGSAAFGLGLARFLAEHKGPVTGDELLQFFIENAVMFAAMEACSALARPMTNEAALWGRARRLGVNAGRIAAFENNVSNLMRDLASYSVRPGEAARDQAGIEKTVKDLLTEQEALVKELSQKLSTVGDAERVQAEAGEELARVKAAVEGMRRAEFLRALKLKPVGESQSVFSFENAPDAVEKIKDFFPGSRVEPQSDGNINIFLPNVSEPIILTPAGASVSPRSASDVSKLDINRASEKQLAAELPGIGKKLARAIVEQREKKGPFATVDDLAKVPGIRPDVFAKVAPLVVAEQPPTPAQHQAELIERREALLVRAERQGFTDPALDEISRSKLRLPQTTDPKSLAAAEQKIAAAEKSAGAKMDAASKRALKNVANRLKGDRPLLQSGALSGVSDMEVGDALARVAGRQKLGVGELRGVIWAHLKGVPIEKFMNMAEGFGTKARNFALETFGKMADANVRNSQRVLADMGVDAGKWEGGMFALEIARFGYGIEQIEAFEVHVEGPAGGRNIDVVLKNGLRIELKNWNSWEYRTSLANASDPEKPGQFLTDVANQNFDPKVFDLHRYIFRYPAPETPARIKAYLRTQLELYIRGKISPARAKALLDAFDATTDLVTESKARAEGGVLDVPKIPSSLPMPKQPQDDDDKKAPDPVTAP
jgi:competence ComEA-like helix-hairpin-helix protein